MFYLEEEKRGFLAEEDHVVPGVFEIEIGPNEEKEISFVCSLEENIEEIVARKLIDKEIVIPEPDKPDPPIGDGGMFDPNVEDWGREEGNIEL